MKQNKIFRLSAILLVLTLLSTCVISGTFAKYTTSDSANDIAKVAKWGVNVEADLADLFETGYDTANLATTDKNTATVLASGSSNILAPGTSDEEVAALTITGTPEVAVSVTYTCSVTLSGWEITGGSYCPLVIKVTVNGVTESFTNITDPAALATAVATCITDQNKARVNPNEDLATTIKISWSWAFDGDDEKDTALGNLGTAPTFAINIGATVTQLD